MSKIINLVEEHGAICDNSSYRTPLLAGGCSVSNGYLIVKCSRCRSTMQLPTVGVRSSLFQCPICMEGEIECEAERCRTQVIKGVADGVQKFSPYVATPRKDSDN